MHAFLNLHVGMKLNWRRDTNVKGYKKNASPTVIRLKYLKIHMFCSECKSLITNLTDCGGDGVG